MMGRWGSLSPHFLAKFIKVKEPRCALTMTYSAMLTIAGWKSVYSDFIPITIFLQAFLLSVVFCVFVCHADIIIIHNIKDGHTFCWCSRQIESLHTGAMVSNVSPQQ